VLFRSENVVVSLAKSLEQQNCHSIIGVFHNERQRNEELARQAEKRGLTVERIQCRGRWDRQSIRAIRETLRSRNIDLLHTHGYKADIYGYLAARGLRIPIVGTCHLWTRETPAVRFYDFLSSLFLRRFDRVVGVSEAIAESLRRSGIRQSKISVIDNGIDLSVFSGARATLAAEIGKRQRLLVGTVGRLVEQKGLVYFLQAAREVLLEFPDALFVVVGDGPDREKLERHAGELGIQQSVVFTGKYIDMPGAYASLDVFVLASIDEGMPMAVLEALASSRPVVATRVGAVPRLILPEKTGLLVEPRDVHALKTAILRLLRDPALRSELGHAGEALVRRGHSQEQMARNYLNVYEQLARPSGETVTRSEASLEKACLGIDSRP